MTLPNAELLLVNLDTREVLEPELGTYPDGSPFVKEDPEVVNTGMLVARRLAMILRPKTFTSFMAGLYYADALKDRTPAGVSDLILPCIPAARQDRINPTGDVLFSARSVAADINARSFDEVHVLDPHSPVSSNAIRGAWEFPLERVAEYFFSGGYDGVIAPDKGAAGRSQVFADAWDLPLVQADKVRDPATGRLSGFNIEVEHGKHYFLADDICDGGGTFIGLAQLIREQGATADLFVSHGIFSRGVQPLLDSFRSVYTTDSTVFDHEGATTIPLLEDFLDYVVVPS